VSPIHLILILLALQSVRWMYERADRIGRARYWKHVPHEHIPFLVKPPKWLTKEERAEWTRKQAAAQEEHIAVVLYSTACQSHGKWKGERCTEEQAVCIHRSNRWSLVNYPGGRK